MTYRMKNEYELGYRDGESSIAADWHNALNEYLDIPFPKEFSFTPMDTVEFINDYLSQLEGIN